MKDIIRNGRFSNYSLEQKRLAIVAMDCGFTAKAIQYTNETLQNITSEIAAGEILSECIQNCQDEIAR